MTIKGNWAHTTRRTMAVVDRNIDPAVTVRMTKELFEFVDGLSKRRNIARSNVIRDMIIGAYNARQIRDARRKRNGSATLQLRASLGERQLEMAL